jgi:hypothetical protein
MQIDLSPEQIEKLKPLFDDVVNAAKFGRGILVAQLSQGLDGVYRMTVGFLPHHKAKHLEHAGILASDPTTPTLEAPQP